MFVVNTSRYNFSSLLLYIAVMGITSKFYIDITKFNKQPKTFILRFISSHIIIIICFCGISFVIIMYYYVLVTNVL